jgi:hypothetical protein
VEPIKQKAKDSEINDILNKLSDLKAEKFVSETSGYGLDRPEAEATLTFEDNKINKLLVGKKIPYGDSFYAKIDKEDTVFVIGKAVVDELTKDVNRIRE